MWRYCPFLSPWPFFGHFGFSDSCSLPNRINSPRERKLRIKMVVVLSLGSVCTSIFSYIVKNIELTISVVAAINHYWVRKNNMHLSPHITSTSNQSFFPFLFIFHRKLVQYCSGDLFLHSTVKAIDPHQRQISIMLWWTAKLFVFIVNASANISKLLEFTLLIVLRN